MKRKKYNFVIKNLTQIKNQIPKSPSKQFTYLFIFQAAIILSIMTVSHT